MKLNLILLFCVVLISSFSVQAQQKPQFDVSILSEPGRKAYDKILNAYVFRIGPVGRGNSTPAEEFELHRLLKEEQAAEALLSLIDRATVEGALYALFGLRFKDANLFKSKVEEYKSLVEPPERNGAISKEGETLKNYVRTQAGCVIGEEEKLKVIARIETGVYDAVFNWSKTKAVDFR